MSLVDAEAGRAHTYTFGVLARTEEKSLSKDTAELGLWTAGLSSCSPSTLLTRECKKEHLMQ